MPTIYETFSCNYEREQTIIPSWKSTTLLLIHNIEENWKISCQNSSRFNKFESSKISNHNMASITISNVFITLYLTQMQTNEKFKYSKWPFEMALFTSCLRSSIKQTKWKSMFPRILFSQLKHSPDGIAGCERLTLQMILHLNTHFWQRKKKTNILIIVPLGILMLLSSCYVIILWKI